MFDDPRPEFPERNGLATLPIILESHLPLDCVILMLGTTDAKEIMGQTSTDIANGMRKLVKIVKKYKILKDCHAPKILVVVPAILKEDTEFASKLFKGGTVKTSELIKAYKELCKKENIFYLDPTTKVKVDKTEGVHIDSENHKILANLIYDFIISKMSI